MLARTGSRKGSEMPAATWLPIENSQADDISFLFALNPAPSGAERNGSGAFMSGTDGPALRSRRGQRPSRFLDFFAPTLNPKQGVGGGRVGIPRFQVRQRVVNRKDRRQLETVRRGRDDTAEHIAKSREAIEGVVGIA